VVVVVKKEEEEEDRGCRAGFRVQGFRLEFGVLGSGFRIEASKDRR